jgi:hypothetical protein
VDGAERNRVVEEVAEQLDDATIRTVADQHQSEGELLQPGFGDREVEEDRVHGGDNVAEMCPPRGL